MPLWSAMVRIDSRPAGRGTQSSTATPSGLDHEATALDAPVCRSRSPITRAGRIRAGTAVDIEVGAWIVVDVDGGAVVVGAVVVGAVVAPEAAGGAPPPPPPDAGGDAAGGAAAATSSRDRLPDSVVANSSPCVFVPKEVTCGRLEMTERPPPTHAQTFPLTKPPNTYAPARAEAKLPPRYTCPPMTDPPLSLGAQPATDPWHITVTGEIRVAVEPHRAALNSSRPSRHDH